MAGEKSTKIKSKPPFCSHSSQCRMCSFEVVLVLLIGGKCINALRTLEDTGVAVGYTVFAKLKGKQVNT